MVKFRKRFTAKRLAKINERIVAGEMAQKASAQNEKMKDQKDNDHDDDHQGGHGQAISTVPAENKETEVQEISENTSEVKPNQRTLILDAICTPADIRFPTDLGLLNEAREKLDEIIDKLHEANGKKQRRPRTYRQKARKPERTT